MRGRGIGRGRICEIAILIILLLPLSVALICLAYRSTLYLSITDNEGFNAYLADLAIHKGVIYYPPDGLFTNNYPPLSFFLIGAISELVGDTLFSGRIVAWVGFITLAGTIIAILRQVRCDRIAACFAALLFLGYMTIHYDNYIGMDDPQLFAHSLIVLGVWVYIRYEGKFLAPVGAALLITAGLFVKHNIIALPLSLTLWLVVYNRTALLRFVISSVVFVLASFAVCRIAFGSNFISSLLAPRQYSLGRLYEQSIKLLLPMQIPLAFTTIGGVLMIGDRYAVLFTGYTAIAVAIACLTKAGVGTGNNAGFDIVIAFSLAGGYLVSRLREQPEPLLPRLRPWIFGIYAASAIAEALFVSNKDILLVRPWIEAERNKEMATREAIHVIATRPSPALCETLAICYWAHKPVALDSFNYMQGVAAGTKDINVLLNMISHEYYKSIQIIPPPTSTMRDEIWDTVQKHYQKLQTSAPDQSTGVIFVSRE